MKKGKLVKATFTTKDGKEVCINVDNVSRIERMADGTKVIFNTIHGNYIVLTDSFDDVIELLM